MKLILKRQFIRLVKFPVFAVMAAIYFKYLLSKKYVLDSDVTNYNWYTDRIFLYSVYDHAS